MTSPCTDIGTAIEQFKQNKMIIVMDHISRENEADLICAAAHMTAEQMAFMIRYSSGYVCAPMTNAIADKLDLPLMNTLKCKAFSDDRHSTAYTITCDYAHGTTTGISARDRALTCNQLANPESKATDFTKPGHIVPLRARDGGVLERDGHTEAALDLCRLAGVPEVAAICELVSERDVGLMMTLDECIEFSKKHGLALITVDDLKAAVAAKQ